MAENIVVDNPGNGACGAFSFVIGLMPILLLEIATGKTPILDKIVAAIEKSQELKIKPNREKIVNYIENFKIAEASLPSDVLYALQQALRQIVYERQMRYIKKYRVELQQKESTIADESARITWKESDEYDHSCWVSYCEEDSLWRVVYQRENGDQVNLTREKIDFWRLKIVDKDGKTLVEEDYNEARLKDGPQYGDTDERYVRILDNEEEEFSGEEKKIFGKKGVVYRLLCINNVWKLKCYFSEDKTKVEEIRLDRVVGLNGLLEDKTIKDVVSGKNETKEKRNSKERLADKIKDSIKSYHSITSIPRQLAKELNGFIKNKNSDEVKKVQDNLFKLIEVTTENSELRRLKNKVPFSDAVGVFSAELGYKAGPNADERNNDLARDPDFTGLIKKSIKDFKQYIKQLEKLNGEKIDLKKQEELIKPWVKLYFFDNLTVKEDPFTNSKDSPIHAALARKKEPSHWITEQELRDLAEEFDVNSAICPNGKVLPVWYREGVEATPDHRPRMWLDNEYNGHWRTYFENNSINHVVLQLSKEGWLTKSIAEKLKDLKTKEKTTEVLSLLFNKDLLTDNIVRALGDTQGTQLAEFIIKLNSLDLLGSLFNANTLKNLATQIEENYKKIFSYSKIAFYFTVLHFLVDSKDRKTYFENLNQEQRQQLLQLLSENKQQLTSEDDNDRVEYTNSMDTEEKDWLSNKLKESREPLKTDCSKIEVELSGAIRAGIVEGIKKSRWNNFFGKSIMEKFENYFNEKAKSMQIHEIKESVKVSVPFTILNFVAKADGGMEALEEFFKELSQEKRLELFTELCSSKLRPIKIPEYVSKYDDIKEKLGEVIFAEIVEYQTSKASLAKEKPHEYEGKWGRLGLGLGLAQTNKEKQDAAEFLIKSFKDPSSYQTTFFVPKHEKELKALQHGRLGRKAKPIIECMQTMISLKA